jgi:cell wall-associated NlpC family hydrolase
MVVHLHFFGETLACLDLFRERSETRLTTRRGGLMFAAIRFALLLVFLLVLFGGCAPVPPGIADLTRYAQDAKVYLPPDNAELRLVPAEVQRSLDASYNERFFRPWRQTQASLPAAEAFWGVASYGGRQGYAENLQPLSKERWQQLVASLQMPSYPSLARPAITVRNTACRVFPTHRPFFLDPARAGEGYPFDYFQNSALWAGTPVLVTHVSADGAWLFAEAAHVAGWLPAQDLAWAEEPFRATYQAGSYAALLRDAVTLRDAAGNFLAQVHIGAIFPVAAADEAGLNLLVPVRAADGTAVASIASVLPAEAAIKPLPLQPAGVAELANRMLGQLYGWGGLYENRDCSASMRDLFAPFGIWLPRNSAEQARRGGTFHDLAALDAGEKRDRLLKAGVPFYTLVWLKGHIGLYLGAAPGDSEPLLLHNLWGVRTASRSGREGRALVGRLAITTLHPGEERPDIANGRFIERILGMTVLPGTEPR